ncbi:MAG: response regulator transcription factor (plasmid) [Candidatus Manganitrophus sp.]|uniref:response regulator transcription factor n=1 Tax=Candidatus Manganitrophus noduliformans TaxID=2606439 RepID=UPI0015E48582|nr:response regulator transcription factor [Candidatus Manganitrophus noduliformans]MCG3113279.1 response regulator transcription factor [Candidatus Manganitrophus morganii]MDC4206966.1 response regulator transcription factor [Candidatus Manganitrophus sp.]MDC4228228.1 response regulator transcription factor [Candidatus Manganitrophus sp.]WDT73515.1 MAG: response regulator transcription factor [Candidatus Manganitrophus sp.]WDT77795.1 MAG: response regulator transcription factor [Candidatus Ma
MKNQHREIISKAIRPRELTKREREVVKLVTEGYKNKEVAEELGIAVKTVETHRANIMNKLAFRNIAQLVRYAIQKGLVQIEID